MKVLVHDGLGIWLCAGGWNRANFTGLKFTKVKPWPSRTVTGTDPRFALAAHWTTAGGDDALNQLLDHSAILQTFYFILLMTSGILRS